MADPFVSSKSKLAWAKDNLLPDLDKRIREFHNLDPYKKIVEPNPKKPGWEVYKIKLTLPFPESFGNITSDIVAICAASLTTPDTRSLWRRVSLALETAPSRSQKISPIWLAR